MFKATILYREITGQARFTLAVVVDFFSLATTTEEMRPLHIYLNIL